jgi:hypothetical protein
MIVMNKDKAMMTGLLALATLGSGFTAIKNPNDKGLWVLSGLFGLATLVVGVLPPPKHTL